MSQSPDTSGKPSEMPLPIRRKGQTVKRRKKANRRDPHLPDDDCDIIAELVKKERTECIRLVKCCSDGCREIGVFCGK